MNKSALWKKYFIICAICLLCTALLVMCFFIFRMIVDNKNVIAKNARNSAYFADLNLYEKMNSIEKYFGNMDLAQRFKEISESENRITNTRRLIESLYGNNNDVLSVFYLDTDRTNYSAGEPMGDLNKRLQYIQNGENSNEFLDKGYQWFSSKNENGRNACVLYRKIIFVTDNYQREIYGDILVYIDSKKISDRYFKNTEAGTGIAFIDSQGMIAVSSDNLLTGQKFDEYCIKNGDKIRIRGDKNYHYQISDSNISGWKNICYYSADVSFFRIWSDFKWSIIIIMSILIAIIVLSYYFMRRLGRPLDELMGYISVSKNGNLIVSGAANDDSFPKDEIHKIRLVFDEMAEKLKNHIELNFRNEINMKNALIKAYESQMNPHFLYNTLQVIQMLSVLEKNKEIGEITTCLGKLLRFNLYEGSETTLGAEIENINNYFTIVKYRYGNRFSYKVAVCNDILDCRVIKFMLQPFIENSMNHGFAGGNKNFEVAIIVIKMQGDLAIVIRDSGCGIDRERLRKIKFVLNNPNEKTDDLGVGIRNVNERIKLIYGDKYGVDIFSTKNESTQVVIHLPYNKKEGENENV